MSTGSNAGTSHTLLLGIFPNVYIQCYWRYTVKIYTVFPRIVWICKILKISYKGLCRWYKSIRFSITVQIKRLSFKKWFHFEGRCVPYVYGGCGGSENLFNTKSECSKTCDFRPTCSPFSPCDFNPEFGNPGVDHPDCGKSDYGTSVCNHDGYKLFFFLIILALFKLHY